LVDGTYKLFFSVFTFLTKTFNMSGTRQPADLVSRMMRLRLIHHRRPSSTCPRRQAPLLAGPWAPAAATTERVSPSSSSPPSFYASPSLVAAMLTPGSSPRSLIRSRSRSAATGRMGETGLVTRIRWRHRRGTSWPLQVGRPVPSRPPDDAPQKRYLYPLPSFPPLIIL
jgi:hypothetical protein